MLIRKVKFVVFMVTQLRFEVFYDYRTMDIVNYLQKPIMALALVEMGYNLKFIMALSVDAVP